MATERVREQLILRLYHGQDAPAKAAHEFRSLQRLRQAGYPVPKVHALVSEESPFGRPFVIMERITGGPMWSRLLATGEDEQRGLLETFCRLFVWLHRLEWRPFADDAAAIDAGPYACADRWLGEARRALERAPMPGLVPVVEWLARRRDDVPCARPAVVHGDFHPGNVLVQDDGSPVVIDWTSLQVSDPRFDLGWTLLLTYAYAGSNWRQRVLREYERQAGAAVECLDWFDAAACARRLHDVAVSLTSGPETLGMRPEATAQIRAQMPAVGRTYEMLRERTGVAVPEVERLLAAG
jgi:aminoglycoside phosphotransferase (APT) family kinase protein